MTEKWQCPHCAENAKALVDAAENVVIAFGMGWKMDGVIEKLKEHLPETSVIKTKEQ